MRDDVCANCGQRIWLVHVGPQKYMWLSDPDKKETWVCQDYPPEGSPAGRKHAPVSGREMRR